MPPTGQQQSTGQFGRFRLSNHPKLSHNTAANAPAPGQCSRFRVSDFVPYDSSGNHSSSNGGGGVSNSGGGAVAGATGGGSSNGPATPERLQKSPTMNTTPVANGVGQNGAGSPTMKPQAAQSGFGMLRMETQTTTAGDQPPPPLQQQQQQSGGKEQQQGQDTTGNSSSPQLSFPTTISLQAPPTLQFQPPAFKFDPMEYPEVVRWELTRILSNIQQDPHDLIRRISNSLLTAPSLEQGSLLHNLSALYPMPLPPPPLPTATATPQPLLKRKRGRPPKTKPGVVVDPATLITSNIVETTAATAAVASTIIVPTPQLGAQMQPPPLPLAGNTQNHPLNLSRKPLPHQICTRCEKPFNPAWRPTPASDPSSEATCAVRHPYADFASGLVLSHQKKRSSFKQTWRWRCCGREVQSSNDDHTVLPRKEDDKTGGWCFVGKHTTDVGVREKLGLKSGKGKNIGELANLSSGGPPPAIPQTPPTPPTPTQNLVRPQMGTDIMSPQIQHVQLHPPHLPPRPQPQPQQHQNQQLQQQQSPPQTAEDLQQIDGQPPIKRKRGRPKGSKTKNRNIPSDSSSATANPAFPAAPPAAPHPSQTLSPPNSTQHIPSPTHQLLSEASTGTSQPQIWPAASTVAAPAVLVESANAGLTPSQLGMLVSATAAMANSSPQSQSHQPHQSSPFHHHHHQSPSQQVPPASTSATPHVQETGLDRGVGLAQAVGVMEGMPAKRGRGRPKGVKNGSGKLALERKKLALFEARERERLEAERRLSEVQGENAGGEVEHEQGRRVEEEVVGVGVGVGGHEVGVEVAEVEEELLPGLMKYATASNGNGGGGAGGGSNGGGGSGGMQHHHHHHHNQQQQQQGLHHQHHHHSVEAGVLGAGGGWFPEDNSWNAFG